MAKKNKSYMKKTGQELQEYLYFLGRHHTNKDKKAYKRKDKHLREDDFTD